MKLIDTDETVLLVTGSDIRAEERDRPIAYELKAEIDRRGDGVSFRRAVVVGDTWFLEHRTFHANPTIAIGGPGVNALSAQLVDELPTVWRFENQAYIQADFESETKRACIWGMNTASTGAAVQAFIDEGLLTKLLSKIWTWRTEVYV